MSFENLHLIEPILRALKTEGYTKPTPIQEQAIPILLQKRDLIGCAQTGTGKTAAFAIPILQTLFKDDEQRVVGNIGGKEPKKTIKALILTPTRELAHQVGGSFFSYGKHTGLRYTVIYGGVPQNAQTDAIKRGVDILIATPGRLLDLIEQKFITLKSVKTFVLDEADRMLDMGFINDVKKIITMLPVKRQTLLFSATMPGEIQQLADSILHDPARVAVTPVSSTVDSISQALYYVDKPNKKQLLLHLLKDKGIVSALVFTRTKHGADRVARDLHKAGIHAEALHGDKSQNQRQRALNNFKDRKTRVLVATDIAARGIDVEELTHVINFDLPNIPETYVHRIGRTGRAGLTGTAISFCDTEEKPYLKDIQKLTVTLIPVIEDHPFPLTGVVSAPRPHQQGRKPASHAKSHHSERKHSDHPRSSSSASSHEGGKKRFGHNRRRTSN